MGIRYEEYYKPEDIRLRIIAYQKCGTTMITLLKDKYREETYIKYLSEFKSNKSIHKIVKVENGIEEILLERNKGD